MKKQIAFILAIICIAPMGCIEASAAELDSNAYTTVSESKVRSVGIITGYSLSLTSSGTSLLMTARTNCLVSVKSVGLKNIVIQRSSDNSNWSNYTTVDDLLKSSSSTYSASRKNVATVPSGYYYRITCKHYAKESGLFGSSESISNTSNSIYIS